jgi:hypothetical protein
VAAVVAASAVAIADRGGMGRTRARPFRFHREKSGCIERSFPVHPSRALRSAHFDTRGAAACGSTRSVCAIGSGIPWGLPQVASVHARLLQEPVSGFANPAVPKRFLQEYFHKETSLASHIPLSWPLSAFPCAIRHRTRACCKNKPCECGRCLAERA